MRQPPQWLRTAGRRGWTNSSYPEWDIRSVPGRRYTVYYRGRYYISTRHSFPDAVRLIREVTG